MKVTAKHSKPTLRFHWGWRYRLRQVIHLLSLLKYAFDRKRYPLFTMNPFKGGFLKTLKIVYDLKVRRSVEFNGAHFTFLMVPHFPSKAYDRMVSLGGLNSGAAGTPLKRQIDTIILGITRQCDLRCRHCYEHFNIASQELITIEKWKEVIAQIQQIGCNIVVLSGGEPMARFDGLLELLKSGNKDLSDFHVHTSGHGVTVERSRQLRASGLTAAAVGLDDIDPERHDALRGFKGAHCEAIQALHAFHDTGVFTYVNLCLSRDLLCARDIWRYFELVKSLNVGFIQMLEPRPCGGYFMQEDEALLTEEDREKAKEFFVKGNSRKRYRDYPIIHYVAYAESPERMGCMMGGLSHLCIDSLGNVTPCVFLPVTFGNILEEDFPTIFARMRDAIPRPVHKQCPSLLLVETLREQARIGNRPPIRHSLIDKEWEAVVKE